MRFIIVIAMFLFASQLRSQTLANSNEYLSGNRIDLRHDDVYIKQNIIGFTVMHGSKKAEEAELALIKSQLKKVDTLVYILEVDAAMGYYFNLYLQNGDEDLLKDLILTYKIYVPQEASVAMFNKWKELRELSKSKLIAVYGIDRVKTYKYFVKLLLEGLEKDNFYYSNELLSFWNDSRTSYSVTNETPLKQHLRKIVAYYNEKSNFISYPVLSYFYKNLSDTFKEINPKRDSVMFRNYMEMREDFGSLKQFIRMGIGHMTKSRFVKMSPSFLARLIENNICKPVEIYSTIALLHNSKVLLERDFDDDGKYKGYTEINEGYYTGENIFPGVKELYNNRLSDMTFYDISKDNSPFKEVKGVLYPGFELLPNTNWLNYFDGAILIDSSEANEPIESIL